MLSDAEIAARYSKIRPYLDERQRRLWLGVEAQALGRAGAGLVARATGTDVKTVRRGRDEIEAGLEPDRRVRGPGGGRPSVSALDAGVLPALEALVDPGSRGDPMSPLRWTTKSTANLAAELTRQGHAVSARTVASLLAGAGYSLQGNAKTVEGKQHPDRDAQFRYINEAVTAFQDDGSPVISVDAKKKENVGNFKNGGAEWAPAGQPERVSVHDFADEELGKAVPYGIYDLTANAGWVNVGTDHDTGAFAVASIRSWWNGPGRAAYPGARRLLITADSGGSNGSRLRLWKTELAAFAAEAGLDITVTHLPPGTSKWNQQVEPDRAPAILRDHHELAGPAAGLPRGHHRDDQRGHHQDRLDRQSRPGHRNLPQGDQDSRQGHEGIRGPPPPAPRVSRELELHHPRDPARRHDTPERWELIIARALNRASGAEVAGSDLWRDRQLKAGTKGNSASWNGREVGGKPTLSPQGR